MGTTVGQIYLRGAAFCERMQALVSVRKENRAYPKTQRVFVRPSLEAIIQLVASGS